MKRLLCMAIGALAMALATGAGHANDRYVQPPPVLVSPDLSAPWVMQLRRPPAGAPVRASRPARRGTAVRVAPQRTYRRAPVRASVSRQSLPARQVERRRVEPLQVRPHRAAPPRVAPRHVQTAQAAAGAARAGKHELAPEFLPATVPYDGPEKPGTIIVKTAERHLYYVLPGGKARRYGVGVGKEGFEWSGTHKITAKKEWPGWTPPAEMIAREKKKGRILPAHMRGGPANPLGARALYIGSTLYRIHGTNAPWTIGHSVSSGCIRMRNQDVIDLYERVHVGAKVKVI